jgi:hypothetical protein
MNYTFASVSVTAGNQAAMQDIVGDGYFNGAGYSEDGTAPATHYLSSGAFDNTVLDQIMDSKLFELVSFGMETNTFGLMPVQTEVEEQ